MSCWAGLKNEPLVCSPSSFSTYSQKEKNQKSHSINLLSVWNINNVNATIDTPFSHNQNSFIQRPVVVVVGVVINDGWTRHAIHWHNNERLIKREFKSIG